MIDTVKKEANNMLISMGEKEEGKFSKQDEKLLRDILGSRIDLQAVISDEMIKKTAYIKGDKVADFVARVRGSNLEIDRVSTLFKIVSLDFLEEFKDDINWDNPDLYRDMSFPFTKFKMGRFLFQFKDYLNWEYLLQHYSIEENELIYFHDYVDWDMISANVVLSEEFMKEYKDSLNWNILSAKQSMSDEFILHMNRYINFKYLVRNQKLSMRIINTFLSRMDMDAVCQFQSLDDYFLIGHAEEINWTLVHGSRMTSISTFVKEHCADFISNYRLKPRVIKEDAYKDMVRKSVFEKSDK